MNTSKFGSEQTAYDGFAGRLWVKVALDEPATNAACTTPPPDTAATERAMNLCVANTMSRGMATRAFRYTLARRLWEKFRRFNPTSGVWMERTYWKETASMNAFASSDYSRSGWCPGSDVPPVRVPLGNLDAGAHELNRRADRATVYRIRNELLERGGL